MPHHIAVNRDGLEPGQDPPGFVETEDYVELDGECLPGRLALPLSQLWRRGHSARTEHKTMRQLWCDVQDFIACWCSFVADRMCTASALGHAVNDGKLVRERHTLALLQVQKALLPPTCLLDKNTVK